MKRFLVLVLVFACMSVPALVLAQRSAKTPPQELPVLGKLSFSKPDQDGWISVTGKAGAVSPDATVYIQCLETGALFRTTADTNGAFTKRIPAPSGSTLVINYGLRGIPRWKDGGPALQLTVNSPNSNSADEIHFTVAGGDGQGTGYWIGDGVQNGIDFERGDRLEVKITFRYYPSSMPKEVDLRRVSPPQLQLCRFSDAEGRVVQHSFVPTLMTPTGLPIFSKGGHAGNRINVRPEVTGARQEGKAIVMSARYILPIDDREAFAHGHFFGRIHWRPTQIWPQGTGPKSRGDENDVEAFLQGGTAQRVLPVFRIGKAKPPRLPWMLLANTLSNGTRGAVSRADKDKFALGDKVVFHADKLIVPKDDPSTGRRKKYRLEPFLPTIGYAVGGADRPTPPIVKFLLPSGTLHVLVERPDGKVDDLGERPFRAARAKMPGIEQSVFGSSSIRSIYQLTTLDDALNYEFDDYGHYVVRMTGHVRDAYGTVYHGGGVYDVYVAKTLDLDLGTFLGTPFEVGNVMSPTVHVRPGVPADVQIDLRHFENSNVGKEVHHRLRGRANQFGYFHPGNQAQQLIFRSPGEYVVDVTASYTDSAGTLWMGSQRGASVVETPNPKLIAHGKRGITHVYPKPTSFPLWYRTSTIDPPGLSGEDRRGTVQLFTPYMSGDVLWAADGTNSAIAPVMTFDDPENITRWKPKAQPVRRPNNRNRGRRETGPSAGVIGELPAQLPDVTSNKLPAVQYPHLIDRWLYYYHSVQRPGVTVRSFVGSGSVGRAYWGFGDVYNWQLGNGRDGDLPDDVKLQYGGVVYRDTRRGINEYAIYGSMAVMIAKGTRLGQRVFPPFQGAAGGPSGGPLLTLAGNEIDIFITPTGVVPGAILETGDTFSFSGAVWPTLPSRVDVKVTSPSGKTVHLQGHANKIGHFHNPQDDFIVNEPGIYTTEVHVTHDGMTSAGPVEEPYPTGTVLGAMEGTYHFYVVPKHGKHDLRINLPSVGLRLRNDAGRHPNRPLRIVIDIPAEIREPHAHVTVLHGGTVIASRTLEIHGRQIQYMYDLHELRKTFRNLDQTPSDTIVISVCVTGTNADGKAIATARQILLQGRDVFAMKP